MGGSHAPQNEWKDAPSILRELAGYVEKLHHDRAQGAPSAAGQAPKSASIPPYSGLLNRLSEEEAAYLKELMGREVISCFSPEGLVPQLLTLCRRSDEASVQAAAENALLVERCRRYKKQALHAAEQYKLLREAYGRLKKRSGISPKKRRVMTSVVAKEADPCDSAPGPPSEEKASGDVVQCTPHELVPSDEPGPRAVLATPVILRFAERGSPEIVLTQEGANSPPEHVALPGCLIRSQQHADVWKNTESDDQIGQQVGGRVTTLGEQTAVLQHTRNGAESKQQGDAVAGQPFKYREVVRGKRARENLQAQECEECARFYAALESWGPLGPGSIAAAPSCGHTLSTDRQALCALSSRHRYVFAPPDTPNGFWDMGLSPEGKQGQRPSAQSDPTPRRFL